MSTLAVVEALDVLSDFTPGLELAIEWQLIHQLYLERAEETFDHRVIPAVRSATHARCEAASTQHG